MMLREAVGTLFTIAFVFAAVEPARAPLDLRNPVQDKNFYLLSVIERSPQFSAMIRSDAVLLKLGAAKRACVTHSACPVADAQWTESEIQSVATRLGELYAKSGLALSIRQSGVLARYRSDSDAELIVKGWTDAARGMNHMIDVYGRLQPPRYAAIDSASEQVGDRFKRLLHNVAVVLADDPKSLELFFQPTLRLAMLLMTDVNHRDEAGRLEPLERGENATAIRQMKQTDWKRYKYPVIVIPGSGSDSILVKLSSTGRLRLRLAARRYRDGLAPFILVSGGYVHPAQTPNCEALEMKRMLMQELGVPETAIIIDPHARHTTTNLRNAARQMYRYGMPLDQPSLITTDESQSTSIASAEFKKRCLNELGYEPIRVLRRTSPFDLEFTISIDSLHQDPIDPLDP